MFSGGADPISRDNMFMRQICDIERLIKNMPSKLMHRLKRGFMLSKRRLTIISLYYPEHGRKSSVY